MTIKVQKLNESYSSISGESEILEQMFEFLKVERPGAYFEHLVKAGFKSPYDYFSSIQQNKLLVLNGHLSVLKQFGVNSIIEQPDFTEQDLNLFLTDIYKILPFEPYDYQIKTFKESILNVKQVNKLCTSAGKSLCISLMMEFFRKHNMKGLLLVPNTNLLEQFKQDIFEYNLTDLYENTHVIGGGQNIKHFDKSLTISTWQSLANWDNELDKLDYVICDECHRFASEVTSDIVTKTTNCRYKYGFTGTLPDNPVQKMQLLGLFGLPKIYMTSRELIDRKLGTPVLINSIIFNYPKQAKSMFKSCGAYPKQLKFIKEYEYRNLFVVNLACKLQNNSLVLFSHTEHGKLLFIDTMKKLFPNVEVKNKDITGKKSFEFQQQYNVFFINGEDDTKIREKTRKILEISDNAILFANFQILSTGANIKKLHNLIFAAPLKSYTTITQSIGRLMRLHESKTEANVYDLVDNFGIRKPGGIFYKQYQHRLTYSYTPEEFPVRERYIDLF